MAQEQSFENLNLQGINIEQDNININPNNLSYPNSVNGTADLNLYRRQDVVTGTPPYSRNQTSQPGGYDKQWVNQLFETSQKNMLANQDTKRYSKPMLYDSSPSGAHKARYLAYGQETYDKVGFNPMIDNEALFNAHTSQFDDWVRMASVAAPMYIQGFLAPMKSYAQAFSGNFGADTKEAIDFEEASAIGYSTKGGALGFLTNVQNSVAYSAGVLTQAVLENALIGALTGSAGGPGGTAAGGVVGGVTGLLKGAARLPMALGKMAWGGGKMLANLKNAKNFEAAKDMFMAGSKTTANFFNPLENTVDEFAKNVFSNADNLGGMARAARTAGGFYRDVNLINSALSEGRLEGGFVENETYKTFYDDHFKRFNKAPTTEEQLEYRKRAKLAGFQDTWQNTLLINFTNKLAFPNLFRGNFMSQVVKKVGSGYEIVLEKGAKGAVDATFKLAEVNLKNGIKSLAKPGTYGKVGLEYFKTNIFEGAQEVGQDILSEANKKYYIDSYYDKSKETFDYAMSSLWSSMGHQANKQGFETFASGFLMGGFLRPFNGMVPKYLAQGYNKYWKHRGTNEAGVSNYQVEMAKQQEEGQKLVDTLNTMRKNGVDFLNGRAVNYGAQSIIAKKQQSGQLNKREVIDSAHLSFVSDAVSSIQAGTYDAWLDNFKTFKNLTPEQIEEVWELEKGEGQKALNKLSEGVEKAEQLKKAHEYAVNNIAKKKVNLMNLKVGSNDYEKAVLYNKAIDASLFSYVYMTSKFQDNLERVNALHTKMSEFPALKKLSAATVQDLTEPNRLRRSLSILKTEIDAMDETVSPFVKEEKQKKNEIYYALRKFQATQKEWFNTFLNRSNIEKVKKELLKENPNLTDNELEQQAIEKVTQEFESNGVDPMADYKDAFVELLKTLSEDQVDYHKFITELNSKKSKTIDDIFEDLVDVHYLNVSNKNLVDVVNFLSAPEAFNEHVDKNLQWMTDLYENRNDYHKKIVNQSFEAIANRDALQDLADQGIYLDLDQFADYVENQDVLPEFFIDAVNERIITPDSVLYQKYLNVLDEALEVKEKAPAGKPDTPEEKLNFLINEKNKQRDKELSEARLAFEQDIENELGSPFSELAQNQTTIDTDNVITQSDAWKFYQKVTDRINKQYDDAIQALKDKYTVVEKIEPSTDAMAKAVEEVKAMLLSDDEYTATQTSYLIKGKAYERMTNRIRVNYDNYSYDARPKIEKAFDETIGADGLTEDSIKDFISALKKEGENYVDNKLPGFEDYTYTELEEELKSLMDEPIASALSADTQAKQADIERRRQEELESRKNKIEVSRTEYTDTEGNIYQVREFADGHAEYWMIPLEAPMPVNISSDSSNIFTKEYLEEILDHPISEGKSVEPKRGLVNKINAKYDAELAALESTTTDKTDLEELNANPEFQTFNVPISKKQDIKNVVAGPLLKASEIFWDKNIRTTGSWIEIIQGEAAGGDYIEIAYDSLSEENKKIADKLKQFDTNFGGIKGVRIALGNNLSPQEAQKKSIEIANKFKQQDLLWYKPKTLQDAVENLKETSKKYPDQLEAVNKEIERVKDTWGQELNPGEYFDKATKTIWASEELYKKSKGLSVSANIKTEIPRSVQKQLDKLNDKIDKLNEQIDEADTAGNKARGENLRMRRQELYDLLAETSKKGKESIPEIKSDLKTYIVNTAIENTYESSKANGIYLDNQFKAVFDPNSEGPKFDPKFISQEAYDNLFGEDGYITNIKKRADAGEFYVFSTDLIVYADNLKDANGNALPPVAGEIDFIFVDREGRKFIVDLKTGTVTKFLNYNTYGTKSYEKKIENTLQQVGYANLAQKKSGDEFQIAIFPLELGYTETGFINKAGKPSNPLLMLNEKPIGDSKSEPFIINLDKNMKFRKLDPENPGTFMDTTAMDFMEEFVTGPVTPGKKAKPKAKPISQDEATIVDNIIQEINNGNTIKAGVEANNAKTQGLISDSSYKTIIDVLNNKMNTMLEQTSVLAAPGQKFITINDIFAEKFDGVISVETKVNSGEIVTVEKVDDANQEIILVSNNGDKFTVKYDEMVDYIVTPEQLDDLAESKEPTYQPTQAELDFAAESISNVDDFLNSSELRNEATDEADRQTPDDIDNDLFSNLKC